MGSGEVTEEDVDVLLEERLAESPEHWHTGVRLVDEAELGRDRPVERARGVEPLRVASLLLYCESDGVAVPAGTAASLLPS